MSGSHSTTISDLANAAVGGNRRAEACEIMWAIEDALRKMVASGTQSITLFDRAGNNLGTLSWTPKNAS